MSGKTYREVAVGERFEARMEVTERHLALGAELIGDFNPLHVDAAFAARSRYGRRILHGVLTSAIMGAPVGMHFAGTAIGYLEHAARFLAPVGIGDVLTTTWTIVDKTDKPRHDGGIVHVRGECHNQDGTLVATAEGRMLVANGSIA